jgi:peptide/nickel transport system substrate-binding protein
MGLGARHRWSGDAITWLRRFARAVPKLLVAVALAVLAAACASPESVRKDDALVVLLPRAPESLDPRHVFDAYGLRLSRLVFASLVTIDPATLAPIPDLAERVEFLSPTEVRVVLRAGLRFSDGSALDSADVKATFDAVRDPAVKSRYARTYARVRSIDTPDALTVLFHLDGPHAPFLTDLELPVLRAEDARGPALRAAPGALVGAGPFRLLSASGSELDFAHNPHWHGGAVRAPHVRFIVVRDDNTRAMRLRAGGADLLLGAVPPLLLPLFSDATRFSIERAPGIGTSYVGINVEHPRLADVRVRRAIQLAIDRDALIEAKLAGYGESTDSWFPAGHWAASVDAAGAPTF